MGKISKILVIICLAISLPATCFAYVGPGPGIYALPAFSYLLLFIGVLLAILFLVPLRMAYRLLFSAKEIKRRVIIIGFDGVDPKVVQKMIDAGKMEHFKLLAESGSFQSLETTNPAISPVAWSSFQTGTNPGKHGIFDFIRLSASRTPVDACVETDGKHSRNLRKSKPYWEILSEKGISSHLIRIPVTYPPAKIENCVALSGLGVPDITGTLGQYSFFTEKDLENGFFMLKGPTFKGRCLTTKIKAEIYDAGEIILRIGKNKLELKKNELSEWVKIEFKKSLSRKLSGIARFHCKNTAPLELYVSPVNIDPEKPVSSISYPNTFSMYLAKKYGPFSTLGLAEDTNALNDGIIDEKTFLQQCYDNFGVQKKFLFNALEKTKYGWISCVFDITDRIQHMFLDGEDKLCSEIEDVYTACDKLLGKIIPELKKDDLLMVVSDHGFKPFKRCFHVNSWLHSQGYISKNTNKMEDENFNCVDWDKTKAFALGLNGICLTDKALKQEIINKLSNLVDPETNEKPIKKIYDSSEIYSGAYTEKAPDLIIGYNEGYRVAWDCANGVIGDGKIFSNNTKHWKGDHSMDPSIVPGIFLANKECNKDASITDIAPTVLSVFNIDSPSYMDGRNLLK